MEMVYNITPESLRQVYSEEAAQIVEKLLANTGDAPYQPPILPLPVMNFGKIQTPGSGYAPAEALPPLPPRPDYSGAGAPPAANYVPPILALPVMNFDPPAKRTAHTPAPAVDPNVLPLPQMTFPRPTKRDG